MTLRNGWLINEGKGGEQIIFILRNGSPYQMRIDPEGESAAVLKLEPGYYDEQLNPVAEKDALAEGPEEDDDLGDLDELDEALGGNAE